MGNERADRCTILGSTRGLDRRAAAFEIHPLGEIGGEIGVSDQG